MRTNISREKQKDIVADWAQIFHRSDMPLLPETAERKSVFFTFSCLHIMMPTSSKHILNTQLLPSKNMDYWAYEKGKWDKPWYNEGQNR